MSFHAVTWSNGQGTPLLRNPTKLWPAPSSRLPHTQHPSEQERCLGLKENRIPKAKRHTAVISAPAAAQLSRVCRFTSLCLISSTAPLILNLTPLVASVTQTLFTAEHPKSRDCVFWKHGKALGKDHSPLSPKGSFSSLSTLPSSSSYFHTWKITTLETVSLLISVLWA